MITLLIPTMNRPTFLIRLLHYYSTLGFQGCICIGDSSDTVSVERTKRAIMVFQSKLNIIYHEYPDVNPVYRDAKCVQQLLDFVSTPYVALLADDDFLVPTGLERCVQFLESHPDYKAAHGVAVGIGLNSVGAYGQAAWAEHYKQPAIEEESASQRLLVHLRNYSVNVFSVHRTESSRKMYEDVSLMTDTIFARELLPCCLSVIQGKVKELDCLYMVRQEHDQRYLLPDINAWTTNPKWPVSCQNFCDCLAKELARQDNISIDEAQRIVKQALSAYLDKVFGKPSHLWKVAGMIPGMRRVWSLLRSMHPRQQDRTSLLKALLHPSSSYYDDFMPIYRSLTTIPAESSEESA